MRSDLDSQHITNLTLNTDGTIPSVTLDAATGKFYLQPGTDAHPVRLNGLAVEAPTELRRGDRLQVGVHEFEFLA